MSIFRLSGLTSGLDTENLIKQLIQIERRPAVLMEQNQHILELRKELWQETNTSLAALFEKVKSLLKPDAFTVKTVKMSDETVMAAAANADAASGTYDISIINLAKAHRVSGTKQASSTAALGLSGTFSISDGVYTANITVSADDSLTSIVNKINSAGDVTDPTKSLRVSASIVDNTLVLQHKYTGTAATGTNNTISFTDSANMAGSTDSTEVLESLGVLTDGKAIANELQAAEDAQFTVNSISVTRANNSGLNDVINGVTLNLLKEGSAATLTIANDTDTMVKSIKGFVDAYNSVMDLINTRLSETPVKGATTDTDLRKGLMRGDSLLVGIKTQLRLNVSNPVSGLVPYDSLTDIGITTTSEDFGKSGKLVLDETKLKNALETDPQSVYQLFFNDTNGNGSVDAGEQGIAARLYNQLDSLISAKTITVGGVSVPKGTISAKIGSFDSEIKDYDERIAAFDSRMEQLEANLWKQFTEMEKALSTLNNQATWLAGQLNSLSSSGS